MELNHNHAQRVEGEEITPTGRVAGNEGAVEQGKHSLRGFPGWLGN